MAADDSTIPAVKKTRIITSRFGQMSAAGSGLKPFGIALTFSAMPPTVEEDACFVSCFAEEEMLRFICRLVENLRVSGGGGLLAGGDGGGSGGGVAGMYLRFAAPVFGS